MPAKSYSRKRLQLLVFLGTGFALVLGVLGWSTYVGREMTMVYAPTVDAVMEIKTNGALAHLWLEEHLAGDPDAQVQDIESSLNRAQWFARALLVGGANEETRIYPLPDRHLQVAVEDVERSLKILHNLARERLAGRGASASGTQSDRLFDAVFKRFLSDAGEVEIRVQEIIESKQRVFLSTHFFLAAVAALVIVWGTVVLLRYLRQRELAEMERERLLRDLATKNQELEGILSVASHDFRSPLVNIQGFSRELAMSCEDFDQALAGHALPPEFSESAAAILQKDIPQAVAYIEQNVRKMDQLIKGLLKVSRLGRVPLEPRVIDMQALVGAVVASMQFQIRRCEARVHLGALPPCWGDENQLNQVFTNLLDNALKYVDPRRQPEIRIEGGLEAEMCHYTLADNGIGISPDHQNKIFDIFHRLYPERFVGDGLGLTIVKRILTRLGGAIEVNSEEGKGCRFHLFLPRGR